eukprot:TRINITY_DN94387_c0_g1_i1.p1 TRINITY_DN94387_c0_g1~~TRINITY_DN94387_c0_g1_i1.p1  ORF type:complete len:247 (-),score=59.91 TRINITY_DN94387_c0_g1_i1:78-818(-)
MACRFWEQFGNCTKGDACKFSHGGFGGAAGGGGGFGKMTMSMPGARSSPYGMPTGAGGTDSGACKWFALYGNCTKGNECKFAHVPGGGGGMLALSMASMMGLPMGGGGMMAMPMMSTGGMGSTAKLGGVGSTHVPAGTCRFYAQFGNCSKGDACKFASSHVPSNAPASDMAALSAPSPGSTVPQACRFFAQFGNCTKGDDCKFLHIAMPAAAGGNGGATGGVGLCKFFQMYGNCTKGNECKFSHAL